MSRSVIILHSVSADTVALYRAVRSVDATAVILSPFVALPVATTSPPRKLRERAPDLEECLEQLRAARVRAARRYRPPLHLLEEPRAKVASPPAAPASSSRPTWPAALRNYQGRRA